MAFPSSQQYIYTACTNPSLTACCLSDQEVIVAKYTGGTEQFVGCMTSDGTFNAFIPTDVEAMAYGFTDCTDCGDINNGFGLEFISCCDSLPYYFLVDNDILSGFTLGDTYAISGNCYTYNSY